MATGEAAVHGIEVPHQTNTFAVHVRQEHGRAAIFHTRHDDRVISTIGARNQPLQAIDKVIIAITHCGGVQQTWVGTGTGCGFGHAKARACFTLNLWSQPALFLCFGCDFFHQMNIAFIRRMNIHRGWA